MEQDKVYTCRLFENEVFYLNKYFDGKFSMYVHDSFKRDIMNTENNKKQNKLAKYSTPVITLGIGAIFVIFSLSIGNLLGFIIVFLLGVLFMTTGLMNIYLELNKLLKVKK